MWEQTFTDATGESKYLITRSLVTPAQADALAERIGCKLTKLETPAENSFVSQIGRAQSGSWQLQNPWIGLVRVGPGVREPQAGQEPFRFEDWQWTAGGTLTFDGFAPWEPNNQSFGQGPETRVAINEHAPGWWNDLPNHFTRSAVIEFKLKSGFRIETPQFLANSGGQYVGLRGTSSGTSLRIAVLDNELQIVRTLPVTVDSNGTWEKVIRVGSQGRFLLAQDDLDPEAADIIEVQPTMGLGFSQADEFEKLKKADAIFCSGGSYSQWLLIGANFSHVALYTGSDSLGRPMIAEAILDENIDFWQVVNQPAVSLGRCQVVPLHHSTPVSHGYSTIRVAYKQGLSASQIDGVATFGASTNGLPYWSVLDFLVMRYLYFMWNPVFNQPYGRFERRFWAGINAQTALSRSGPRMICSTLVWQAYLSVGLDIASNTAAITGGFYGDWDAEYRTLLATSRAFVHPDSLATSGAFSLR